MSTVEHRPKSTRLECFSDGVMAIIVTLMIFELKVPDLHHADRIAELLKVMPKALSFVLSFIVVAIFWTHHHQLFHQIRWVDRRLIWHNNIFLLLLSFIPFTAAMLGDYPREPLAVGCYGAVLMFAALAATLMYRYAALSGGMLDPHILMRSRRRVLRKYYLFVAAYGVAAASAWLPNGPRVSLALYVLVLVLSFLPDRVQLRGNRLKVDCRQRLPPPQSGATMPPRMAREYTLHPHQGSGGSGIDYVAALNAEQYQAVSSPPGKALVIAGAGSGKTRTLTYRVAWLLDHGIDPRQILLLTFTNKAAREMSDRVRELVPQDISTLWAGTFHSIGSRILRRHAEDIGFTRSFSILDRDDQKSLLSAVIANCEIDTKLRRFPKPEVLASMFSLVENTGRSLQQVIYAQYPHFIEWEAEIEQVQLGYAAKKVETNSMDFDDLLVMTVRLFEERPDIVEIYRRRFKHVLVDEFQDTNAVQGRMIDLIVGESNSLMAVGDDAQSIYSWRGAEVEHILKFPERHPGSRVFTIETNYRSVPEILELSNAAIRANTGRHEKNLQASREGIDTKPALVALEDPRGQAAFIAQRMLELRDEGVPLEEMAVLYRAHHQSLEIQMELTVRGIPFAITSGLRFFEQAHVKDVAAFMRFVANRRDEVSFLRMVNLLPGCGPIAAQKLWNEWLKTGWAGKEELPGRWSELLLPFKVPKKAAKHWEQLCYTLDELSPDGKFARPSEMIHSILEGVYDDYLKASYENYDNRRSDIEQLSQYGATFDDLLEFLEQLSLMSAVDGDPTGDKSQPDDEKVTLSSIHQAKGLEWQAVFVIWLVEGQFPNSRILEADDLPMLEEERRLFYVAITRAKDDLYLSYPMLNPKSYSGDIICRPSRFLEDFPESMVEEWQVRNASPWGDDDPF